MFSNSSIAEALGYRQMLPAFLDPNLKVEDLPYGVSFASAATGFDDYTANVVVHFYELFSNIHQYYSHVF